LKELDVDVARFDAAAITYVDLVSAIGMKDCKVGIALDGIRARISSVAELQNKPEVSESGFVEEVICPDLNT
jgi:hypothetical protein